MERSKAKRVAMIVLDKNGLQGTAAQGELVSSDPKSRLRVHFQNGQQVIVPGDLLVRHADGRYHLPVSIEELLADQESRKRKDTFHTVADDQPLIIPVTQERVKVQTHSLETEVVEIHKTVHERTEIVDQPVQSEEVEIERVAINRIVEEPVPIRHEGDTMIVSLLEEVLVVEKRLVLREEVHIKKLHKVVHDPKEVRLREERVEILRKPGSGHGYQQDEAS